jgi:hypothetical protein
MVGNERPFGCRSPAQVRLASAWHRSGELAERIG